MLDMDLSRWSNKEFAALPLPPAEINVAWILASPSVSMFKEEIALLIPLSMEVLSASSDPAKEVKAEASALPCSSATTRPARSPGAWAMLLMPLKKLLIEKVRS